METIKISVEVSVNLSESTQNFIKSLFTPTQKRGISRQIAVDNFDPSQEDFSQADKQPDPQPAPQPAPTPQPAAPAPGKPDVQPAPSAPAAQAASSANRSIEEVRALLSKKVNKHREAIKAHLNKLGSPSVTQLDPSKYNNMYDFLANLE